MTRMIVCAKLYDNVIVEQKLIIPFLASIKMHE